MLTIWINLVHNYSWYAIIQYVNHRLTIHKLTINNTGWWFGTMEFYDFPYIGSGNPN